MFGEEFRVSVVGFVVMLLIVVVFVVFSLLLEGGNSFWDVVWLRGNLSL